MGLVLATTTGLVVWLVLWSIGVKAIDSFMITTLIVATATMVRIAGRYVPGRKHEPRF